MRVASKVRDEYEVDVSSNEWGQMKSIIRYIDNQDTGRAATANATQEQLKTDVYYDGMQRPVKITRNGHTSATFAYDALNRPTKIGDARGNLKTVRYDDVIKWRSSGGNSFLASEKTVKDTDGSETSYGFDGLGRLSFMTQLVTGNNQPSPAYASRRYRWNDKDNLESMNSSMTATSE
jgi:YD repeat-containing protein